MNQTSHYAFIVKKLKEAGAVILGKTNLTEFANFISVDSPNGYSALGGQVKNSCSNNIKFRGKRICSDDYK